LFRVALSEKYPQLAYLMAMHVTAPQAHEAVDYYGYNDYPRHPVGCGPYVLSEWAPKQKLVLRRNPNFFGQTYPDEGRPEDVDAGLLADAGQPIPFIDE